MAQQGAPRAEVNWEESVDVSAEQAGHSAFGRGTDKYTDLVEEEKADETVSSRGNEELGHLVEEVSPNADPAKTTTAAIYIPESGTYSRPDTGRLDVGPIGSTLKLDEQTQERLEKLEPPAGDARLLSSRVKRGATEIDKNLESVGATATPPQEPASDESHAAGQNNTQNAHDLDPMQQLEQAKIFPVLVDRIEGTPALKFEVKFKDKQVCNGTTLQPEDIQQAPEVLLYKSGVVTPEDVYLLLLVNMDFSEEGEGYLHWLVQNVPSPTEKSLDPVRVFGQDMTPYKGKSLEKHGHDRLVFLLYKMKRQLPPSAAPRTRENFVARHFAVENDLGNPVAALYFKV